MESIVILIDNKRFKKLLIGLYVSFRVLSAGTYVSLYKHGR
jgi:hypothetical protein